MIENNIVVKKIRMHHLKSLLKNKEYSKMIKFMSTKDIDELNLVFEMVAKSNNVELVTLYASKTKYRNEFINNLFYNLEYTVLNPVIRDGVSDEAIKKASQEIVRYGIETKKPDVSKLKELIKLSGNPEYMYSFWLWVCYNEEIDLVDEILSSNKIEFARLLYSEFWKTEYGINVIAPILLSYKEPVNEKVKKSIARVKSDINKRIDEIMLKFSFNFKSENFNLEESLNEQNSKLNEIIEQYNSKELNKREIIDLIEERKLPLIGTLKFVCNSENQIDCLIDKLVYPEYSTLVKENYNRCSEYTFMDQIFDIAYNQVKLKEKTKTKK